MLFVANVDQEKNHRSFSFATLAAFSILILIGFVAGKATAQTPGFVYTLAGTGVNSYSGDGGPATSADIGFDYGIAVDSAGNLFISDSNNQRIRKVTASTGIITTIAGNGTAGYGGDGGPAVSAVINTPEGIAVDGAGNVYFADFVNARVRRIDTAGNITTVAGNGTAGFSGDGGLAISAELNPTCVHIDASGIMYICDGTNQRVRKVDINGFISTYAGTGTFGYNGDGIPATSAQITFPRGIVTDPAGNLYIADSSNSRIRMVNASTGIISTVAGNGTFGYSGDGGPATSAGLGLVSGVAYDSSGNVYVSDNTARIRIVSGATGIIDTFAGNGTGGYNGEGIPATSAQIEGPLANGLTAVNGHLYFADSFNARIRWVF